MNFSSRNRSVWGIWRWHWCSLKSPVASCSFGAPSVWGRRQRARSLHCSLHTCSLSTIICFCTTKRGEALDSFSFNEGLLNRPIKEAFMDVLFRKAWTVKLLSKRKGLITSIPTALAFTRMRLRVHTGTHARTHAKIYLPVLSALRPLAKARGAIEIIFSANMCNNRKMILWANHGDYRAWQTTLRTPVVRGPHSRTPLSLT